MFGDLQWATCNGATRNVGRQTPAGRAILDHARIFPLAILERLVSFDTESSRSNLALIDFVEDVLRRQGVSLRPVPNAAGDKAAVFATIGPQDRGGVVLSGPYRRGACAGQAWTSDPFTLRVADGRPMAVARST